jgi:hypothetical protein
LNFRLRMRKWKNFSANFTREQIWRPLPFKKLQNDVCIAFDIDILTYKKIKHSEFFAKAVILRFYIKQRQNTWEVLTFLGRETINWNNEHNEETIWIHVNRQSLVAKYLEKNMKRPCYSFSNKKLIFQHIFSNDFF